MAGCRLSVRLAQGRVNRQAATNKKWGRPPFPLTSQSQFTTTWKQLFKILGRFSNEPTTDYRLPATDYRVSTSRLFFTEKTLDTPLAARKAQIGRAHV